MRKIFKYSLFDLARSRWTYGYFLFYLMATVGLLYFSNDLSKTIISMMNIILVLNSLIATLFGALYYYSSKEFAELLLALPLKRSSVFMGKYLGLSVSLSVSFLLGTGIPFVLFGIIATPYLLNFVLLIFSGIALTFIFSGLSFLISILHENSIRGFGISIFTWLFFAVVYDGILLITLLMFKEYPLERYALVASLFNPIDLSRILIMLKLDIAALMGYTGAVYQKYLGSAAGIGIALGVLMLWICFPIWLMIRKAAKKDF